mmetsp:Transcript_8809/g.12523  ORF Transcript_8809/g.12523 Transcript_8809/m.12523 type:complete len:329 (+) Transcript_8809:893-1879(+)
MVIHSVTNKIKGFPNIKYNGYRIKIIGNTVYENYNEIYSWSSLKTIVNPHIDEGKGITVQKTQSSFNSGTGRILIANNVVYANGFSGVHLNFAKKVDIYHNTAVDNSTSGRGSRCGITVTGSFDVNVINNIGIAMNGFGCAAYGTDKKTKLIKHKINFSSNLVVGEISKIPTESFIISSLDDLKISAEQGFKISSHSSAASIGDDSILDIVKLDKDGVSRSSPPDLGAYTAARCSDNKKKFLTKKDKKVTCKLVSKLKSRCNWLNAKENCPISCETLPVMCCSDNSSGFPSKKNIMRTCEWASKKKANRCKQLNVKDNCPVTCEVPNC